MNLKARVKRRQLLAQSLGTLCELLRSERVLRASRMSTEDSYHCKRKKKRIKYHLKKVPLKKKGLKKKKTL